MNKTAKAVTIPQKKALEGILFWRRGKHFARTDETLVKEYDANLRESIHNCDRLGIPFSIQNAVLMYDDVHSDILDVFQDHNITVQK